MHVITLLFSVLALIGATQGARILAIVPTPTKSHHNIIEKLALDLVAKGHQVTLMTAFPQEKPVKNLEEIIFPNFYDDLMSAFMGNEKGQPKDVRTMQMNPLLAMYALPTMGHRMGEIFLSNPVVQNFIKSDRKYDVVIGEAFFIEGILAGFSQKYKAPLICVGTGAAGYFTNYLVGNPSPTSYIPSILLSTTDQMSFFERTMNFVLETIGSIHMQLFYLPKQDSLMRQYFGQHLPDIKSILANTSLVLVNHYHSLSFPRPYLPNMIEIGGFHVKPVKPLPEDLKKYMDGSKNGVILLSMGSHMKSSLLPEQTVQAILKAIARLKENVIWKFDRTDLQGVPKNVRIMKWVPQSDLLAHPNLKLFITHGGILSIMEAVTRGVPLIGLPVFGDQPSNVKFIEKAGYGKSLPVVGLTENLLYETISEMVNNPEYKAAMVKASSVFLDRPSTPSDTATYWVEYVIRHKGASHLRSAALDLTWYELYLIDVFAVIFGVIAVSAWLSYKTMKFICCKICRNKSAKTSKKKKTN